MTKRILTSVSFLIVTAALVALGSRAAVPDVWGWESWTGANLHMTAFASVSDPAGECGCDDAENTDIISDADFFRKAEDSNMLETALGEMASERGASADVRQLGRMMAKDHVALSNELLVIAKKDDFTVPGDMDRTDYGIRLRLLNMKGRDFDCAYIRHIVEDYTADLELCEQAANSAANPDLRDYARQILPTLREHLRIARNILDRIERRE